MTLEKFFERWELSKDPDVPFTGEDIKDFARAWGMHISNHKEYIATYRPRRRSITNDLPEHRPSFTVEVLARSKTEALEMAIEQYEASDIYLGGEYCWEVKLKRFLYERYLK